MLSGDNSKEAVLYIPSKLSWSGRKSVSVCKSRLQLGFVPISISLNGNIVASNPLEEILIMAARHKCNFVAPSDKAFGDFASRKKMAVDWRAAEYDERFRVCHYW